MVETVAGMRGDAVEEILRANAAYAAGLHHRVRSAAPARRLALVTCMDARIDVARCFGVELGGAHVIRNAGGIVTDDAIRSLVVSHHLLGTIEAVVIGHTDCGLLGVESDDLHARLGPASEEIDFQPFADVAERVRQSVEAIRTMPLLADLATTGFVFDVRSGRLEPV